MPRWQPYSTQADGVPVTVVLAAYFAWRAGLQLETVVQQMRVPDEWTYSHLLSTMMLDSSWGIRGVEDLTDSVPLGATVKLWPIAPDHRASLSHAVTASQTPFHRHLRVVMGHQYLASGENVDLLSVDTGVGASTLYRAAADFAPWRDCEAPNLRITRGRM